MKKMLFYILLCTHFKSTGQVSHQLPTSEIYLIPFWGTILGGYVDQGAYINFAGPSLGYRFGKSQFLIGMLPTLRFKKDTDIIKNSWVIPTLGFGLTYTYKAFAIQVPLYYTSKTSITNGHWHVGLGIGFKISEIKSLKK